MAIATTAQVRKDRNTVREYTFVWEGLDRSNRQVRGETKAASETVVICHHGSRSAYVTRALQRAGFREVLNLEGGVDAYADVEGSVPRY